MINKNKNTKNSDNLNLVNTDSEIYIASWKKYLLLTLILSEIGLTPFLARAVEETLDIAFQLITAHAAPDLIKISVGYGLAIAYVLSAMLSVGNINRSVQKLMAASQNSAEIIELNYCFKLIQQFLIGSSFIIGSAAAAIGVIRAWGESYPFIAIAAFTLTGQVVVVLLQANKRILSSAHAITLFFQHSEKKIILKTVFSHIKTNIAILNTLFNTIYWGAFYYYTSATICETFETSRFFEVVMGLICAGLGGYMAFCTQGIDELQSAYQYYNNNHDNQVTSQTALLQKTAFSQIQDPNFLSLSLIMLAFSCRTIATVSFSYSLISGQTFSVSGFSYQNAIIALSLAIPGAGSALQYVKYIHNQLREGLDGVKNFSIDCLIKIKNSFFCCRKKLNEQPQLVNKTEQVQPLMLTPTINDSSSNSNKKSNA